jgi:hypothetical protein
MDKQAYVSLNPKVEKFYNSLTKSERKAHEIAARPSLEGGLGSSYIVELTPAFIKWSKKEEQEQEQK